MKLNKAIIVIILLSLIIYAAQIIIIGMINNNLIISFTIATGLTPFNVCFVDWLYRKSNEQAKKELTSFPK